MQLSEEHKERIFQWIVGMKHVIANWESIRYERLTPERIQERNERRKKRRKSLIANQIVKSL